MPSRDRLFNYFKPNQDRPASHSLPRMFFSFFHCVNQTKSISTPFSLTTNHPPPTTVLSPPPIYLSLSVLADPHSLLLKPLPLPSFLHKRFHPLSYIIRIGISNFNLIQTGGLWWRLRMDPNVIPVTSH